MCPCQILLCTGVAVIIFMIGVGNGAEMATGLPEIFPPEHNQVQSQKWQEKFSTVTIPKVASLGGEGAACAANFTAHVKPEIPCVFYWCEAPSEEIVGAEDATSGFCWRGPVTVREVYGDRSLRNATRDMQLNDPWSTEECQRVSIHTRLAAPKHPQSIDWKRTISPAFESMVNGTLFDSPAVALMERLALENWESGKISMSNFWDTGSFSANPRTWNSSGVEVILRQCEIQTMCFFGAPKCGFHGWRPMGEFKLSQAPVAPARRLNEEDEPHDYSASERRLVLEGQTGVWRGPVLPENKRVDVTIVFGLRAAASTPLVGAPEEQWSYDPTFEPENPWAQRAIYAACLNVPAELKVITTNCWIAHWKTWLGGQTERFPSRKFDAKVVEWFTTSSGLIKAPTNIWLVNAKVQAVKIAFMVNFRKDSGAAQGLEYSKLWDKYVESFNSGASISANRAWHTAALFVRAEAEVAVIDSTVETIIISAVCGWFGMLVFTKDPWTSALVTSLVLGIISGLAFFMVVLMHWKIGPIEVISLVVFVGYSVTYSLHIAHNYVEVSCRDAEAFRLEKEYIERERRRKERFSIPARPTVPAGGEEGVAGVENEKEDSQVFRFTKAESRRARTRMAVLHVGGATMSSAVSTMGSSMFLLFCTLNIFVKLGSVVIAVTLLSIFFALVPLPALLMSVGPSEEDVCTRYGICLREAGKQLPSPRSSPKPSPTHREDSYAPSFPGGDTATAESQPLVAGQAVPAAPLPEPAPPPPLF